MILVARVSLFIMKFWKGSEIDQHLLLKAALLHDLGNIVKFDFDRYPQYLGKEQKNIAHWKEKQQEMIKKYGTDDHQVTLTILKELKVDPSVVDLIGKKSFHNTIAIRDSKDWELKMLLYADLRVGPKGIMPLKERLEEAVSRLAKYQGHPELLEAAYQIEGQIQEDTEVPLEKLTYNILPHAEEVLKINI